MKSRNLRVFALFVSITTSLVAAPKVIKKVLTGADAVRAAEYWTPERRAAAIPIDAPGVSLGAREIEELVARAQQQPVLRGSAGPAATTGMTPENAASLAEFDYLRAGVEPLADDFNRFPPPLNQYKGSTRAFPYIAIGRLFMRFDGVDFSCSAAVINPGRLVATTRRCIFSQEVGFADIVNFFPGYQNGLNPDLGGGWTARVLLTFDSGGRRFDIGIMQMFNYQHNGCKAKAGSPQILSFTGFLGTFQGGTYTNGTALQALGYPGVNIPGPPDEGFTGGRFMHQCSTHQKATNRAGNVGTIEFGCDLTAGTTGGPVIHSFKPNHAGDRNLLRSLVSFRLAGPANASNIEGPQFQADNFGALLNASINEPCP